MTLGTAAAIELRSFLSIENEVGGKGVRKRFDRIVIVDEMQFGFISARGMIAAVFIVRRMQEEYHAKGKKLYMCFVDLEIFLGQNTKESVRMFNAEEKNTISSD